MSKNPVLRPFRAEDYVNLQKRECDSYIGGDLVATAEGFEKSIEAWTFEVEDGIVGCFGAFSDVANPTNFITWTVVSPLAYRYSNVFGAIVKRMIAVRAAALGAHRLEAHIPPEHPHGAAFVQRLGFFYDGVSTAYFPNGDDSLRYVKKVG